MIRLDGSTGEGGGQILRSALGLSLVTGQPFTISHIRANRKKPGLMRQHLTAVRAAAEIGAATLDGDYIGSSELSFSPQSLTCGKYAFAIGTAGSCTLVFQAILPGLLVANAPSEITIEGGTHNPYAPPFDFLQHTFLPQLARMGANVSVELIRPGFFPAGGGKLRFSITPASKLTPIELMHLSNTEISAQATCAQLPEHICRRELNTVRDKLDIPADRLETVRLTSHGPGNILSIFVKSQFITETFTGFGEKRVSAEKVAARAARQVTRYLESNAPVGEFLADQLLIPMALAGEGCFRTGCPTQHTLTNMEIIRTFLPVAFDVRQRDERCYEVRVKGEGRS